ncbi:hypothetical protein C8R45DRAFT_1100833 [Mycena sanguinolenta]|nr:hypothetical protein C8R45DRAFT_1100833 [Mycena sanguinolenta]
MPDMTAGIHSTLLITFFRGLPSVASKYSELFETNKDDRKELPASIGIARLRTKGSTVLADLYDVMVAESSLGPLAAKPMAMEALALLNL